MIVLLLVCWGNAIRIHKSLLELQSESSTRFPKILKAEVWCERTTVECSNFQRHLSTFMFKPELYIYIQVGYCGFIVRRTPIDLLYGPYYILPNGEALVNLLLCILERTLWFGMV